MDVVGQAQQSQCSVKSRGATRSRHDTLAGIVLPRFRGRFIARHSSDQLVAPLEVDRRSVAEPGIQRRSSTQSALELPAAIDDGTLGIRASPVPCQESRCLRHVPPGVCVEMILGGAQRFARARLESSPLFTYPLWDGCVQPGNILAGKPYAPGTGAMATG